MSDKKLWRAVFKSPLFLWIALVLALALAVSFARAYYKDYQIRVQITDLQERIDEMQSKKLESLSLLDYVKSEEYLEDVGRSQLGLKKEGERVIIVDAQEDKTEIYARPTQRESSWKLWWNYFFGV